MRAQLFACIFIIIAAVLGVQTWQDQRSATKERASDAATPTKSQAPKQPRAQSIYGREVRIPAAANNQYYIAANINNRNARFLVDTGASYVALRESDARRAGVYLIDNDFKHKVSTANGTAHAAFVTIDEIDIEGLRVHDVETFIMPDNLLNINLLGMSYLSKLDSIQTKNGTMVLKQ